MGHRLTIMVSSHSSDVHQCAAFAAARTISACVGEGRAVTAGGALKPALVPQAAAALGVPCPAKVRRLSDVPAVHRAWVTASAVGLIEVSGGKAVRAEKSAADPRADEWFTALEQVLRAQVTDPCDADPRLVCLVVLTVVAEDLPPRGAALRKAVAEAMRERGDWDWRALYLAEETKAHPVDQVIGILTDFGALDAHLALTALGEYARTELGARLPAPITPDLPAAEVLRILGGMPEEEIWEPVRRWLDPLRAGLLRVGSQRDPLRELLVAAAGSTPAGRISAIEVIDQYGEEATPLWRELRQEPMLGAHARCALADLDAGPEPAGPDLWWAAVDHALAALERYGAADAWYVLLDATGRDGSRAHEAVRDSGHPGAAGLLAALPPVPPSIPAYQLKISLYGGLWRRVAVPENLTLGALHEAIRALFGWGDDHLHVFDTGRRRYADPFHGLEECGDEYAYRVNRALPSPGSKIIYTYDLGDCWKHEIAYEKVVDEVTHPICVGGRGDNPIEDYNPEYPEDPVPFDQEAINTSLAGRFASGS